VGNEQLNTIQKMVLKLCQSAWHASRVLALTPIEKKNQALLAMANAIQNHQALIQTANNKDIEQAKQKGLPASMIDRLTLNEERLLSMVKGLETIAVLSDPVGRILSTITRPNGLKINKISVPIGVLGVIYESRPNVTVDAAGLCLKSGNAVILRGGSESFYSSSALVSALHEGLKTVHLPTSAIEMIPTSERTAIDELLKMEDYIDVIIPRGGQSLIDYVSTHTRIPLFKHLAGLCHTYIHQGADKKMAENIVLNAKMRRTGICGATEVLLIDQSIVSTHLPDILSSLLKAGCEIRGDEQVVQLDPRVHAAAIKDYDTEFLDAIIAIKVVNNLDEAIQHIMQHGTHHTDAIITEDRIAAQRFFQEIDSAIVMHNASTQFADGGEFGMGAEMGIATGKLHARGPVGAEQLTTFKYLVEGSGQIRI